MDESTIIDNEISSLNEQIHALYGKLQTAKTKRFIINESITGLEAKILLLPYVIHKGYWCNYCYECNYSRCTKLKNYKNIESIEYKNKSIILRTIDNVDTLHISDFDPEYLEAVLDHVDKYIVNGIYMYYDSLDSAPNDISKILSTIYSTNYSCGRKYTFSLSINKSGIEYGIN